MIEPEKTEDKFSALAEEFNKSAKLFAEGNGLSFEGLMAKFDILWKFKAECVYDQHRLTEGLFNGGMEILRKISQPSCHDNLAGHTNNIQQIFNFVTKPEQMAFLPDDASEKFVDAALNLIRKSENVRYEYNWNDYAQHKEGLISLARTVTGYAEKTRAPTTNGATFAVAKPMAPAKRLTVSCPDSSG